MYYGNFLLTVTMRMSIRPSRTTMSGPTNMANPELPRECFLIALWGNVTEFSLLFNYVNSVIVNSGNASRIIPAIFKSCQSTV